MNPDLDNKISTYTGRYIDLLYPQPEDIDIVDIARALSCEPRFGGHTKEFYSVAQHSVMVSHLVPPHLAVYGLLHDAAEAYVKDLPTPLKQLVGYEYKTIEKRFQRAILKHFSFKQLEVGDQLDIFIADRIALASEAAALCAVDYREWFELPPKTVEIDVFLLPKNAEIQFINRCKALGIWEVEL